MNPFVLFYFLNLILSPLTIVLIFNEKGESKLLFSTWYLFVSCTKKEDAVFEKKVSLGKYSVLIEYF